MRRNSSKISRVVRRAGLVAVAAAITVAPVATAAAASAAPAPAAVTPVAAGPGIVPVDYPGWYHWHCQIRHEWWRPRCHAAAPVQPGGPMIPSEIPSGSG